MTTWHLFKVLDEYYLQARSSCQSIVRRTYYLRKDNVWKRTYVSSFEWPGSTLCAETCVSKLDLLINTGVLLDEQLSQSDN